MKQKNLLKPWLLIGLLGLAATPFLQAQPVETYTFTPNKTVPDGNAAGLADVRTISSPIGDIASVKVRLKASSEFNGDLYVYLRHVVGGNTDFAVLLNRAGKSATKPGGYGDSGFDVTFQDGAANGDIHLYQTVTIPTAGNPLTGIWQPDGRTADPAVVTDASSRATSLSTFGGVAASGEWTLFVADVESGGTTVLQEWALEITGRATPTITWANPADITYGTPLSGTQLNATATYNSTPVPGTFSYTPAAGTVLSAGNGQVLSVTFTPTDTTSFLQATAQATINVLKAPLGVTADPGTKVYGQTDPALTYQVTGLQNGDQAVNVLSGALARAPGESVGSYAINQGTLVANANYTINFTANNFSITPATLTVTADAKTKVYGSGDPALTYQVSGLKNGDLAANVLTGALTRAPGENVGTFAISKGTLAANANYSLAFTSSNLTITEATLTVTADPKSKVFGSADPALTYQVSGLQSGDLAVNVLTGALSRAPGESVGTYAINQGTLAANANYTIAFTGSLLTITKSDTAGTLTSSSNPALPGANVTFTMTVTAVAPGVGVPTGSVSFRIDGAIAGTGNLTAGVATFTTSSLAVGSHTVVGEYGGDANFQGVNASLASPQVINTPPVAGNDTIQRYPTQGTKVRISTLLANDSDADGDTLGITVSSTSANGGTIVVSDGWAFYTPAAEFTAADSFTYTLTDGRGGSTIGTVTVAIQVDTDPGPNLTIVNLGNGSFRVDGNGIPGRIYRMQFTDSLEPANWQNLPGGSVTADEFGVFHFVDTAGSASRYYRSVYP